MTKKILLCALVACALAAVVLGTRARRLGLRVESFAAEPGGSAVAAPDLGDDVPFAEQRFAFVENVLGDDASLDESMDKVRQFGGAEFVVLLGNVMRRGTDGEARRLVAACRDRGAEVLAVPGPGDLAAGRADVFARWFGPSRWWFARRGCVYVGVPGGSADDDAYVLAALAAAPKDARPFVFTAGRIEAKLPPDAFVVGPRQRDLGAVSVTVHIVGVDTTHGGEMGASWGDVLIRASPWRWLALDVLFPVVGSTIGYVAFLIACAAATAWAIARLARPGMRVAAV